MNARLLEIALFVLPITVFFLGWWSGRLAPSPTMLASASLGLVMLAAALFWFGVDRRIGPSQRYVPAQLVNGRIEPGHGADP